MNELLNTQKKRTRAAFGQTSVLVFVSMIAGFSSNAMAGSESDCVVQISQPLLDYGHINRAQLLQGGGRVRDALVGKQTINLTAVCENKSSMALFFRGEEAGNDSFRFARDGAFTLKVLSAQLDGRSVRMIASDTASGSSEQKLRPGIGLTPYDGARTAAGERLSVLIEVETRIDSEAAKVRTEEVWKGEGQFELETF